MNSLVQLFKETSTSDLIPGITINGDIYIESGSRTKTTIKKS